MVQYESNNKANKSETIYSLEKNVQSPRNKLINETKHMYTVYASQSIETDELQPEIIR